MTTQIRFTGIDCPHCAEKIEKKLNKIKGIQKLTINFLAQKMMIETNEDNIDTIIDEITKIAKKVEKDFTII